MSTQDLFAAAVAHQKAGQLDQAAALYDRILGADPAHCDALHYSALIALRRGDMAAAIDRLRRAAAAAPRRAVVHNDLGAALRLAGRLDEAAAALAQAVAAESGYADAWNNLGLVRRAMGDFAGARDALERAARLKPDFAPTFNALGSVLKALADSTAARSAFERAIALKPDYVEALTNLGLLRLDEGQPAEALAALRRAVELAPARGEVWHNLGLAQQAGGDVKEAIESFRRAVATSPELAAAWNALGVALAGQDDHQTACEAFARAAALDPQSVGVLSNYGLSLSKAGRNEEALGVLERAVELDVHHAEAAFNRGVVRQRLGDFDNATADWKAALAADPRHREARSNLIFSMQYDAAVDEAQLAQAACEYDRLHGRPAERFTDWPNPREPGRRLRIGYVSPDFRTHSVAHYVEPLFGAHDRSAVELFAYAQVARPDEVTRRLQRLVGDSWRFTSGMAPLAVAQRICADGIDVLVDLAGHSADNRLDVFAMKPAPIQATWLGYPGTTGLSTIDYRLSDVLADPPGAEAHSSEAIIRLPHGFHCWRPPADAPLPAPWDRTGRPTFGSFNNVQKLSAATIDLWSELLRRVPESRLVLKSSWLSQPRAVDAIRRAFAERGIRTERIETNAWLQSAASHLAAYSEIDVALDPIPYNGTTTTLEALWMGVPVVTLSGSRHAARVGASLLTHAAASELIASSAEHYVDIALKLIGDVERLRRYRAGLRPRMLASALLDVGAFATSLEAAYRTMWRRWCGAAP